MVSSCLFPSRSLGFCSNNGTRFKIFTLIRTLHPPSHPPSQFKVDVTRIDVIRYYNPVNIYLFKVNNRNTRKRREIYSKSTVKTPERRQ